MPALEANFPNFTNGRWDAGGTTGGHSRWSVPLLGWRLWIGRPGDLGKVSLEAFPGWTRPAGREEVSGRRRLRSAGPPRIPLKGATTPPCSCEALPLGAPTSPGAQGASSLAPGSLERKGAETEEGVEAGTSVIRESPAARGSDLWVESRAGAGMPPPHLMQLGRFHT